ncbi:DUF4326 domain-containing protein [Hyphomicrobium sp.]|uniref:DUF4326 domain-containing protein n=1 Tax=Hyphomicrobium sp. TaxID=82 RepID=UPI002E2F9BD4|nr:DUF4326 domain-containing protein [Hyphomicrobium sp.]HEX2841379.1 DUF4326 domain-containing protein [Hyphomicrobium sp.]
MQLETLRCKVVPRRIQLKHTKGWRMPSDTRKVDGSTIFGNPFQVCGRPRDEAVEMFREWLAGADYGPVMVSPILTQRLEAKRQWILGALPYLRGKHLACWCPLPDHGHPDLCHASVLIELANKRVAGGRHQKVMSCATMDVDEELELVNRRLAEAQARVDEQRRRAMRLRRDPPAERICREALRQFEVSLQLLRERRAYLLKRGKSSDGRQPPPE